MSDDLIKELRSYPKHYEAAHRAADALEKANRHTHAREYYNTRLEDELIKAEMDVEHLRKALKQIACDAWIWIGDSTDAKRAEEWCRVAKTRGDLARAALAEEKK
jgi:predicted RNase H-like nuclease (RuvC/YqgF family)